MTGFLHNLARRSGGLAIGTPSAVEVSPALPPSISRGDDLRDGDLASEVSPEFSEPGAVTAGEESPSGPPQSAHASRSLAELQRVEPAHPSSPVLVEGGPSQIRNGAAGPPISREPNDHGKESAGAGPTAPAPFAAEQAARALHGLMAKLAVPPPQVPVDSAAAAPAATPPKAAPALPTPELKAQQPEPTRSPIGLVQTPAEPGTPDEADASARSHTATVAPVTTRPVLASPFAEALARVVPAAAATPEVVVPQPAAPESRPVQVRIGKIEIRARTPRAPAPPAPAPTPGPRGFARYRRLRTYTREDY